MYYTFLVPENRHTIRIPSEESLSQRLIKVRKKGGGRTMGLINKVHPFGAISINGNGPRLPNDKARSPQDIHVASQ